MTVEAMPKTPSGKIDRRALPVPDSQRQELSQGYAAPQSELEQFAGGCLVEVAEARSRGDSRQFLRDWRQFADDSASCSPSPGSIKHTELPVVKLFQHPTIAQLANYLNQGQSASASTNNKFQDRADRQRAAFNRSKQFTKRR